MLQQVCEFIHNYFIRDRKQGEFTIANGMSSPSDFLQEGQRFLIVGSVFSDGIYTFHSDGIYNDDDTLAAGLTDEDFAGSVCALAVPPAVTALSEEIANWVEANGDVINSPYNSESFGGYSYTKSTNGGNGTANVLSPWQSQFAGQLNRWRKVTF